MLLIAHAGASGGAPENTIAALNLALAEVADGVEVDVRLTSDGVPVIIHDPRFDRTARQPGRVADTAYEAIAPLDVGSWRDPKFAGEHLPLLEEVVRWSAANQTLLRLHCKGGAPQVSSLVRLVTSVLWGVGDGAAPAEVMCSSPTALAAVRRTHPGVRTGLVLSNHVGDPLGRAKAARADWLHMPWATITPDLVRDAHVAQFKLDAWTVNEAPTAVRLVAAGVDSIETDFPALLRAAFGDDR